MNQRRMAEMSDAFAPVTKKSLADGLAQRITQMIVAGDFQEGDRLPAIMEMARRFGVGHPTVREALRKLETMGIVEIRHGSGVYVTRGEEVLLHAAPDFGGAVTKELLLDLIEARIPIETQTALLAARNATPEDLVEMRRLLTVAGENLTDEVQLNATNMTFHRQIARASGNRVLAQLLDAMRDLFTREQRAILDIYGSPERDHEQHLLILEALEKRDEGLSVERMRMHLEGVREVLLRWDPQHHPVR